MSLKFFNQIVKGELVENIRHNFRLKYNVEGYYYDEEEDSYYTIETYPTKQEEINRSYKDELQQQINKELIEIEDTLLEELTKAKGKFYIRKIKELILELDKREFDVDVKRIIEKALAGLIEDIEEYISIEESKKVKKYRLGFTKKYKEPLLKIFNEIHQKIGLINIIKTEIEDIADAFTKDYRNVKNPIMLDCGTNEMAYIVRALKRENNDVVFARVEESKLFHSKSKPHKPIGSNWISGAKPVDEEFKKIIDFFVQQLREE